MLVNSRYVFNDIVLESVLLSSNLTLCITIRCIILQEWQEKYPGCTWLAGPSPIDVYGKNYINKAMTDLAKLCDYENAERCTSHGKRKFGATCLVNDDAIWPEQTINLTRHSHYSTVGIYEKPSQKSIDHAIATLNDPGHSSAPFDYGDDVCVDDDRKPTAKVNFSFPLQDTKNSHFTTALTLYSNDNNTNSSDYTVQKSHCIENVTESFDDLAIVQASIPPPGPGQQYVAPNHGHPPHYIPPSTMQPRRYYIEEDAPPLPYYQPPPPPPQQHFQRCRIYVEEPPFQPPYYQGNGGFNQGRRYYYEE